jgi:hypothetical protein
VSRENLFGGTIEITLGSLPSLEGDDAAKQSTRKIGGTEVDTTISA